MTNNRISLEQMYDNSSVIQQINRIDKRVDESHDAAAAAAQSARDAADSAVEARTQAFDAARSASEALDAATAAAGDAMKVNQFDERIKDNDARIKESVNHISVTGSVNRVSIGYATDGKPSPLTVLDIPVLSAGAAGVVTPEQQQEITDQLDALGRDQDAIKRDYLKRHSINEEQDITGRVNFKISPFTTTLKPNEYSDYNGHRVPDVASVRADPELVHRNGDQTVKGIKTFEREVYLQNPAFKGQENAIFSLGRLITIFGGVVGPFMYNGQNVSKLPEKATVIGANGFSGVTVSDTTARIAGISFDTRAFGGCNVTKLICTTAYTLVFYGCMRDSQITHMEVNNFSYLGSNCLSQCNLDTLVIRNTGDDTVPVLPANALNDTPISQGTGLIYVRDDLVDAYKQATNWVMYAEQIKPISELPAEAIA